jgi:hypothetical protein
VASGIQRAEMTRYPDDVMGRGRQQPVERRMRP